MEISEYKKIIANNPKVLVYFTAKWCGPCKKITTPYFKKLTTKQSEEKSGKNKIHLLKLDVEENEDLSDWLKIKSLPTILVYFEGKCVDLLDDADKGKLKKIYKNLQNS